MSPTYGTTSSCGTPDAAPGQSETAPAPHVPAGSGGAAENGPPAGTSPHRSSRRHRSPARPGPQEPADLLGVELDRRAPQQSLMSTSRISLIDARPSIRSESAGSVLKRRFVPWHSSITPRSRARVADGIAIRISSTPYSAQIALMFLIGPKTSRRESASPTSSNRHPESPPPGTAKQACAGFREPRFRPPFPAPRISNLGVTPSTDDALPQCTAAPPAARRHTSAIVPAKSRTNTESGNLSPKASSVSPNVRAFCSP